MLEPHVIRVPYEWVRSMSHRIDTRPCFGRGPSLESAIGMQPREYGSLARATPIHCISLAVLQGCPRRNLVEVFKRCSNLRVGYSADRVCAARDIPPSVCPYFSVRMYANGKQRIREVELKTSRLTALNRVLINCRSVGRVRSMDLLPYIRRSTHLA